MKRIWALLLLLGLAACGPNQTQLPPGFTYDDPDGLDCLPNLDREIDAEEMPVRIGEAAHNFVSPAGQTVAVDVAGALAIDGDPRWDWSAGASGDAVVPRVATALDAQWYAPSFPGGEFVLSLDTAGTLDGIYARDASALWLHGVASHEEQPAGGRMLLPYDAPVALVRFPLQTGDAWTATGRVSAGTAAGFPYAGTDTYELSADAVGRLDLPELTFTQVHRLRSRVTVTPDVGTPVTVRQVQFLFECFGEVARATSQTGEVEDNFTTAAEVRRFKL